MNAVFPTCVFYEIDEQDWTFIVGAHLRCDNHVARMKKRLSELPEKPRFIDEISIDRCTIPPISIRTDL